MNWPFYQKKARAIQLAKYTVSVDSVAKLGGVLFSMQRHYRYRLLFQNHECFHTDSFLMTLTEIRSR